MYFRTFATVLITATIWKPAPILAASATADIHQRVVQAVSIKRVSDLDFGIAAPGDGPKTIPPGTSETLDNASFSVRGEPQSAFRVLLPDAVELRRVGDDDSGATIRVYDFRSFPGSGDAVLDANGNRTLLVGATRAGLPTTQHSGSYNGTFTVTVFYP